MQETSPIDDKPVVTLMLDADGEISAWPNRTHRPRMMVRFKEGELNCAIITGCAPEPEHGSPGAHVTLRFDKNDAEDAYCHISTDRKALFFAYPPDIIRKVADAERVLMRFTPFNSPSATVVFSPAGLRAVLAPLEQASGWKLDDPRDILHRRLYRRVVEELRLYSTRVDGLTVRYESRDQLLRKIENDLQPILTFVAEELTAHPTLRLRITARGAGPGFFAKKLPSKDIERSLRAALAKIPLPDGRYEIVIGKENQPELYGADAPKPLPGKVKTEAYESVEFEFILGEPGAK